MQQQQLSTAGKLLADFRSNHNQENNDVKNDDLKLIQHGCDSRADKENGLMVFWDMSCFVVEE